MSSYVEYLRAMRGLRIVAVLLGLLLLGAVVLRLSFGAPTTRTAQPPDPISTLEHSPTAHVTHRRLPDGEVRTIVDDPRSEVFAVIDRRGSTVVNFTYAHTREAAEARLRSQPRTTGLTTTTTHAVGFTNSDVGALLGATIPMGLLLATLLGGPLSKENNGHLEVAWTKPVSRVRYALAAAGVDVTALIAAQLATAVALVLAMWLWTTPQFRAPVAPSLMDAALALLGPIAWYAFLTGLSAGARRGPGIAIGSGWVVAFIVPWIADATSGATTAVGRSVHAAFHAASYALPLSYVWGGITYGDSLRWQASGLAALAALTIVYFGLALVQWRRLEA